MSHKSHQKTVILFIGNYYSGTGDWNVLQRLIENDNQLSDSFIVHQFHYSFSLSLDEVALTLSEKIYNQLSGSDLILVGHGLGAAVIFKYLVHLPLPRFVNPGKRILQVILFAPILAAGHQLDGSQKYTSLLKYMLLYPFNPIFRILRKKRSLAHELLTLGQRTSRLILNNRRVSDDPGAIPFVAICGDHDDIVDINVVTDFFGFDNLQRFSGGHLSIIKPKNESAPNWLNFKNTLMEPFGHRHMLLVRSLSISLVIVPGSLSSSRSKKNMSNDIVENHHGRIHYAVEISRHNICRSRFTFNFNVEKNGYIKKLNQTYKERTSSFERGSFDRESTAFISQFDAEAGQTYELTLEVVNGFSDAQLLEEEVVPTPKELSNYYVPFFLGFGERFYQHIRIEIDLQLYLAEQKIISNPRLLWIDDEFDYGEPYEEWIHNLPESAENLSYTLTNSQEGKWQLDVFNIRHGSIIVVWNAESLIGIL